MKHKESRAEVVEWLVNKPYRTRQNILFVDTFSDRFWHPKNRDNFIYAKKYLDEIGRSDIGLKFFSNKSVKYSYDTIRSINSIGSFILPIPYPLSSELLLPPGHPREDVCYVAHPAHPRRYLPMGKFHRRVFEHKFAEAIRLLKHLGATKITVNKEKGWGKEFAAEASVGIPQAGMEAETNKESSSDSSLEYNAELEGHDNPTLPENLVWYPHEPIWKEVAEGRMKFGQKEFSLEVRYTEDYGINAELSSDVQDADLSLGGSFNRHESTVWSVDVEFE